MEEVKTSALRKMQEVFNEEHVNENVFDVLYNKAGYFGIDLIIFLVNHVKNNNGCFSLSDFCLVMGYDERDLEGCISPEDTISIKSIYEDDEKIKYEIIYKFEFLVHKLGLTGILIPNMYNNIVEHKCFNIVERFSIDASPFKSNQRVYAIKINQELIRHLLNIK